MRTIHSVIKRTPRRYLAEIVMIDDFSNKGGFALIKDDVGCKMAGLTVEMLALNGCCPRMHILYVLGCFQNKGKLFFLLQC